jgi:hypothetical protein
MKPLTPQQKKAGWIIAGILVLVHFAPGTINRVRLEFRRSKAPVIVRPVQPLPTPVPSPAPVVVTVNPQLQYAKFLGIWMGSELTPDQYMCNIKLEVRPSDDDMSKVTGFETRSCIPSLLMARPKKDSIPEILKAASPLSAMMTGSIIDGDLAFRVDKTVGNAPYGCPISSYSVSPFGQGQMMAQWQEGTCKSGQMLLHKARG